MKRVRPSGFIFLLLVSLLILVYSLGCIKDYSFEGGNPPVFVPDTTVSPIDTTALPVDTVPAVPVCALCSTIGVPAEGNWRFQTGDSLQCGTFTNSGFIGGDSKTAFTFFGPSACSTDTGIVVSVYLPVPLDQDRFNINADAAAFYYYDHTATADIYMSRAPYGFSVTLDSFIYNTGIATGTFKGTVFKPNGDTAYISEGKFKAPLY